MDIKNIIKNPYVIVGGVGLGLVVLLSSKGSSNNGGGASFLGMQQLANEVNLAGMELTSKRDAIAADVAKARIESDTTLKTTLIAGLMSKQNNDAQLLAAKNDNATQISIAKMQRDTIIANSLLSKGWRPWVKKQTKYTKHNAVKLNLNLKNFNFNVASS